MSLFALTQDEETIPVELRNLPEYKQLVELKRLKKQTLREIHDDKEGVRHVGYKVTTAARRQQMSKPSECLCQGGAACVSHDDSAVYVELTSLLRPTELTVACRVFRTGA